MTALDLPVLDLADRAADPRAFDAALCDVLGRWGFVALRGHGLDPALLAEAYRLAAELFARPGAWKRAHEHPATGRQRGYTGFGVEHARDARVHDLKEFWQIGRGPGDAAPGLPANVWPDDLPGFRPTFEALFQAFDRLAAAMLRAVAAGTGLDADAVVAGTIGGNSVLRILHYPPIRPTDPPDAVRAAAHEDIDLLTLLPASTHPGLELLDRDGTWRSLVTPPDVVIGDTGDMLQRLTGGRIPSTTHRVVTPPGLGDRPRFSMPFFHHPRPDFVLGAEDGRPLTADDFLRRRLVEIGVLGA